MALAMWRGLEAISIMGTMKAQSVADVDPFFVDPQVLDVYGIEQPLPESPKVLPHVAVPPAGVIKVRQ